MDFKEELTYALLAGRKDEKHGIMKEIGRHLGQQEEGSVMTVASALKQEDTLLLVSRASRADARIEGLPRFQDAIDDVQQFSHDGP